MDLEKYIFDPEQDPGLQGVLYDGLLSAGDTLLWIGREKSRKSNLVLQFIICAAIGRPFLLFPFDHPQPLKVVVVDFETKRNSLHQRYQAVCDALGLTDGERKLLHENLKNRGMHLTPEAPTYSMRAHGGLPAYAGGV